MSNRSRRQGRSFTTTFDLTDEPVWEPLELLSRQVGHAPDLPCFHPAELMLEDGRQLRSLPPEAWPADAR